MTVRRLATIAGLGALGALALGCGPTLGVRGRLVERVRAFSECQGPFRVLQLTENAFEVRGCGSSVELTDVAPGRPRHFELMQPAAALARQELQCDYDALARQGDGAPTERGFEGCGARARYRLACRQMGCHWERVGEVVVLAPTAAPSSYEADGVPVPLDETVPPPPGATTGGAP